MLPNEGCAECTANQTLRGGDVRLSAGMKKAGSENCEQLHCRSQNFFTAFDRRIL
jgi:hypothetical protein